MNNYIELGDLIDSVSKTHKFDKEELIFLNTSDVLRGKILINNYSKVSTLKGQAKKTIQNGDILYSEIRPKNRRYAYVKNLQNTDDYVVSTKLMVLRKKSRELNNDYLYHFLTYNSTINYLQSIAENRIGSFPQITFDILKRIKIWLPKLSTQTKIAKVLSDIDDKIEVNNKINLELENFTKTIYDYWFLQFNFPDKNGKPYKSSGGQMVYNKQIKREIPIDWKVEFLRDEMDLQYGFPFSTKLFNDDEKGVPVIRIRDILNCSISNYSTEEVDDKYRLNKGDLLVGMDGNFHINYWNREDCYLNQRCLRIRSKNNSITEIQTRYSIEPYIKARERNVSRTTVAHLSASDVNDLKVTIADDITQKKANNTFKPILNKIITNKYENQKLADLRDWLLPMLMNGQVTVKEAQEHINQAAEPQENYG